MGAASYYVQGGPAIVAVDGVDTETRFSGKAGVGVPVSDALGVYGEVSFLTADDPMTSALVVSWALSTTSDNMSYGGQRPPFFL